ncbi:MAG TPA: helix-turn-helix domain-containing protein [Actinocatenispora sp.]
MSQPTPRPVVDLTDPRALRALAHPLRLALVGLLRREGPLTATRAGQILGESSASCSFHLRQLAKYGLVEEAGGGTGRQRPWQATARATRWPSLPASPDTQAATDALAAVIADFYRTAMLSWIGRRGEESAEWREAVPFGDTDVLLTAAELAELSARVDALVAEYRADARAKTRAPDARRVMYLNVAIPVDEPSARS